MINLKLDYRLKEIVSNVKGSVICDIGCDHGKVTHYLLSNGMVDFAYISDISAPSLDKAVKLLDSYNYQDKYKAIVSDGFNEYPKDVNIDTAIISGMGGYEIVKILSESKTLVNRYVLQPQHNEYDVKLYLSTHGYNITRDYIIKQKDKFYNIIVCEKGGRTYNNSELYFGEENFIRKSPDFVDFLDFEYSKTVNIIDKISDDKKYILKGYLDLIKISKTRLGE